MPRRKKSTTQNERHRKVRRTDNNDEDTLVISDSENEEEEDKIFNMTSRATRWLEREKRTQVHDMTEEEMLDLAMRLSEQEASSATQREKLEDAHMRKAIAESLNVSNDQASETNSGLPSSPVKPHEESDTVSVRSRRKLTFPSMGGKLSMCSDNAATVTNVECVQKVSPLPSIPDLSQKSLPSSSVLPSVPSAAVQDFQSSSQKDLNEHVLHEESPDDEPSQSTSQLQSTPALKQCSIRLCRDSPSTNKASRTLPCTEDGSLSLTCPGRSPSTQLQSPSPPQSPVFAKTDPKGITEAKCNLYTSYRRFTDNLCKPEPDETFQDSSSHKSLPDAHRGPPKRLSLSGKGQPSGSVSGLEDVGLKQNTKPKESKDEAQGTAQGNTSKSDLSLHTETNSMDEFTSHMDVHVSDDEDKDMIVAQSPVFTEECVSPASQRKPSPTQPCCPPSMTTHTTSQTTVDLFQHKLIPKLSFAAESEHPKVSRKSCVQEAATSDMSLPALEERGHGFISYYWGVPFCPKGQSPDEYTRVILTQLEVYEKSLKEAQRQLLHKAEWGLPLAPCPTERPIGKRLKRHRAPQLLVAEEEEDEDEEQGEEEKKELKVEEKKRESQAGTKERTENGQRETYVVVSSPDPLEEHENKSPLLFGQRESEDSAIPSSCRKALAQDMSDETPIQLFDEHKGEVQNGNLDLGSTSCPETQMTEDETPELRVTGSAKSESLEETEVMEVDEAGHLLAEADEKMEQEQAEQEEQWMESVPPQSQADVECPICSRLFPHSKIEMHAADCNGTVEEHQQQENVSRGTPRRKRTRKSVTEEALPSSDKRSKQQEKCYLCSKIIPGNEYTKHVDQCFQKKAMGDNQKGNGLLSALSQTERGHRGHLDDDQAGPSNVATKNSCGLADPSVAGESRESQASSYFISSSPIKSFTPISEVTDCLIDFSKQYPARANQRLGRKRKFKR